MLCYFHRRCSLGQLSAATAASTGEEDEEVLVGRGGRGGTRRRRRARRRSRKKRADEDNAAMLVVSSHSSNRDIIAVGLNDKRRSGMDSACATNDLALSFIIVVLLLVATSKFKNRTTSCRKRFHNKSYFKAAI